MKNNKTETESLQVSARMKSVAEKRRLKDVARKCGCEGLTELLRLLANANSVTIDVRIK